MAELKPGQPQVNNPELETELIRQLGIIGKIGKLDVLDIVLPIISLGNVVTPQIDVRPPAFRSTDIFSIGVQTAPAVNTILADTGPLPDGTYDVAIYINATDSAALRSTAVQMEHRNAANNANLASWDHLIMSNNGQTVIHPLYSFGYEIAVDERLRARNTIVLAAGMTVVATIFARIR